MRSIQLTRAERREMKRLGKLVDRATEADRLFFVRFPHRQHRARLTSQVEIDQHELIDDNPPAVRPGCRWFTAVHNIDPDFRLCLFVPNLESAETATAREEWVAEPYRDVEGRLRKAAGTRP